MKKHGIGSRLLSLLLVLAMVLPVLPLNAFAAVGDIATDEKVGDTGLDGNIDPSDTISWPIKVYDYLNDGMLFEFANANDATDDISDTLGGAYGGGMPAPQFAGAATVIGTDYTVNWGYEKYAYTTWLQTYSAFKYSDSLVEAVNFVSPRHLHLVPKGTYNDMKPWIMSDFYSDNTTSGYSRDAVRYAVVVYRTSGLEEGEAKLNLGWNTNLTGATKYSIYTTGTITYDYRGSVNLVANSDKWNYVVIDMKAGTLGSKWSTITTVYKVFADFQMNEPTDSVDISHVAYFDTEFEAIEFGKDAVAFDNDPGEFLNAHTEYTEGAEVAVTKPATNANGMDFSVSDNTTGGYAVSTYQKWTIDQAGGTWLGTACGVTVKEVENGERSYVQVNNSNNSSHRGLYLWQYQYGAKDALRYVTVVYKTTNFTTNQELGFFIRYDGGGANLTTSGISGAGAKITLPMSETEWTYVTYDLENIGSVDEDYYDYTYVSEVGMYLPACLTGNANKDKYLDIAFVNCQSTQALATSYGRQAADYMNGKTEIVTGSYQTPQKKWNTGSNVAFGMLFSNYGGGWNYYDNTNGGENDWANGYYSYQIGQTVTTNPDNAQNLQRTEAAQKSYPVSDSIFLLNESATGMTVPYATNDLNFGYTLINTLTSGLYTAGLLESGLITVTDKYGNSYRVPNYKEETVEYIAQMLMDALSIGQTDTSGNYNYNFVKGTANGAQYGYDNGKALDLASALRKQLNVVLPENGGNCTSGRAELGNYAVTAAKKSSLIGSFADCKDSITTFMDAAYYLLHNLYVDDSYNQAQDEYHYLVLSSATLETGETAYVFDGGFTTGKSENTANTQEYRDSSESAVNYDAAKGTISLTSAASKDQVYFQGTYTTSRFPFLPITDSEGIYEGETKSPYFLDDGRGPMGVTEEGATFVNRNYNYAIACNGEFVYHAEDDLFFKFEGDDDVYLFINGELVLDIGAAHSITDVSMKVNDYIVWAQNVLENSGSHTEAEVARANKLNLQEGESYSFDFYYMERHGWGANCRIVSNIRVTDPSIQTDKTAYQDDVEIEYGGIVNPDQPIEYSFSLTNTGNSKLYYLSFRDENIGLTLDAENGLNITGDSVVDKNGETLEVTDLVARVTGYDEDDNYSSIDVHFADNDALKAFLKDLTGEGLQQDKTDGTNSGSGLWTNSTVTIRGFAYKMTEEDKAKRLFDNTVISTANTQHDGEGKTLTGTDSHRVYIASEPLYYEWKDHALYITNEKFKTDVVNAGNTKGNPLEENEAIKTLNTLDAAKLKLTPCLKDGKEWPNDQVTYHADEKYLEVKFTTVGSHQVYVKITSSEKTNFSLIVPVLFNVTDVQDRVYVLDYGLYADIPFSDLTANDVVSVPARVTDYDVMGITNTSPSYLGDYSTSQYNLNNLNRINFSAVVGNEVNAKDGKFILAADKLTFAPEDFMDEEYSSWIAITVHETGFTSSKVGPANTSTPGYSININKEVQMFQKVTVLPATVVYYEDDFPAGKYLKTSEIIEILQTAKEYHIDVIPAFDTPAHLDYTTWKYEQNYLSNQNYSFYSTKDGKTYYAKDVSGCINYCGTTGYSAPQYPYYSAVNLNNKQAYAFIFELYTDIANFFKVYAGSTDFSIGADEVNLSCNPNWGYGDFVDYINELNGMLNDKGYTVRMFNDFIGSTVYNQSSDFDKNIEIQYWTSPFNPTYDSSESTQAASVFANEGRTLYNCIQTHTYYALRVTSDGSDARDPANRAWTFYHSTEQCIYDEWVPNNFREIGDRVEDDKIIASDRIGGAYFLIWCDYNCVSTEKEIWEGAHDANNSNVYYLLDRMWSNTIKMWNWDVNNTVTYSNYAAIRETFGYFPGYTSCTEPASLPAATDPSYSFLADHSKLEAALANKISNDSGTYTTNSYSVYEAAYNAAVAVNADHGATEDQITEAIENLAAAKANLVLADVDLIVEFKTIVDGQTVDLKTVCYRVAGSYSIYIAPHQRLHLSVQ